MIETRFKHTDIGLVPEDWEVSSFGKEFKKLNAASYTWSETIREGSCAYLHYGDIHTKYHDHLDVSKDELPYISDIKAKHFTKLQNGDLIMLNASEDYDGVNDCVEITHCNKHLIAGQHTIPLRPITGKLVNGFIGYIPSIPSVQMQLVENAVGTKVYGVTNEMLQTVLLPIPPKQEQQRIASALMNIDALISNLDKLIIKKQAIKKGAMQELLTGKKRLPGFKGKWIRTTIGKVVGSIRRGQSLQSKDFIPGYIPVIAGGKVYAGFHNKANYTGRTITISGSGASAGYIWLHNTPIFATDCSIISEKESFCLDYIYYFLSYKQEHIYSLQTGGAQPHIYPTNIEDIELDIPSLASEQKAIAHVLSTIDSDISLLEQKRDKYRQIKQGMMHDLLTGRIRLTDKDASEHKDYTVGLQERPYDEAIAAEPAPR